MFQPNDVKQIEQRGTSREIVEKQLEWFEKGFPFLPVTRPATIDDGIIRLEIDEIDKYGKLYESHAGELTTVKFVPASGAATRMFKELFEFYDDLKHDRFDHTEELPDSVREFFERIDEFAFHTDLGELLLRKGKNLEDLLRNREYREILDSFLFEKGLNYGSLPKGLLKFHLYRNGARTAMEEHLVESYHYCRGKNKLVHLHLTVSPEHEEEFRRLFEQVKGKYEEMSGCIFNMEFSHQKSSTDTLAVDLDNKPFRNEDGSLLFRPGGHGALIENLDAVDADLIFIKNIDNVVPDRIKDGTVFYKRAIAGYLMQLRKKVFDYLDLIDAGGGKEQFGEIEGFVMRTLHIYPPEAYKNMSMEAKLGWLKSKLDRPMRICGMVKNVGEPGGGPFWAVNPDGSESLQVVESSQIDRKDPKKAEMLRSSTHFNPVDLVCAVKNRKGEKYNLKNYIDPATGFISVKSKDGKDLKALELPGLWNGAMSDWTTIFVEVPLITFNPVKTVFDLLRPEHKG